MITVHLTLCYLNNYEDRQSIVAEFKKIEGVPYLKEIGSMAPSWNLTKFKPKELRSPQIAAILIISFKSLHKMSLVSFLSWLELTCRNWIQRENWLCFDSYIYSICSVIETECLKLPPSSDSSTKLKCLKPIVWDYHNVKRHYEYLVDKRPNFIVQFVSKRK